MILNAAYAYFHRHHTNRRQQKLPQHCLRIDGTLANGVTLVSVEMAAGRKQGEARRRDVAVAAAKKAVDLSFNPKKVRPVPRVPGAE